MLALKWVQKNKQLTISERLLRTQIYAQTSCQVLSGFLRNFANRSFPSKNRDANSHVHDPRIKVFEGLLQ